MKISMIGLCSICNKFKLNSACDDFDWSKAWQIGSNKKDSETCQCELEEEMKALEQASVEDFIRFEEELGQD